MSHTVDKMTPDIPTLLLVNPQSRRGAEHFDEYRRRLKDSTALVDAALTTSSNDLIERIQDGLSRGVMRFVVGGGDGTLSSAANVLAGTQGVLGVLPLGTGNTFAHGLDLPASPHDLVDLLTHGSVAPYDVGLAVQGEHQRVFLNTLTMGVTQRLVELLSRDAKRRLGYGAWIMEFRRAFAETPALNIRITWPDGSDAYRTRQLVIVNGRTMAKGLRATPTSSGQDGLLEVFRLGGPSFLSLARLGTKLLTGRMMTDGQAHYRFLTDLSLFAQPLLPVNTDGELWLTPPIGCRVWPSALLVISRSDRGPSPHRWPWVTRIVGAPRHHMCRHAPAGPYPELNVVPNIGRTEHR